MGGKTGKGGGHQGRVSSREEPNIPSLTSIACVRACVRALICVSVGDYQQTQTRS